MAQWPPNSPGDDEDEDDGGGPLWSMDVRDEQKLQPAKKQQSGELWLRLQAAQREAREEVERRGEVEARAAELEEQLRLADVAQAETEVRLQAMVDAIDPQQADLIRARTELEEVRAAAAEAEAAKAQCRELEEQLSSAQAAQAQTQEQLKSAQAALAQAQVEQAQAVARLAQMEAEARARKEAAA
eukprot:6969015-Prymnesium_polylepis.1